MSRTWPLRTVQPSIVRDQAHGIVRRLMWFAMIQSTDPEKQKLLDRLHELRIEIQDIMDRLAPGWEKEPGI